MIVCLGPHDEFDVHVALQSKHAPLCLVHRGSVLRGYCEAVLIVYSS